MDKITVKPWYASQTVWGSAAAIAFGIGGAVYAYQQHDVTALGVSLASAAGGFHALVGRFKATTPIGRVLATIDSGLQAGVAVEEIVAPKAPQPQQ
jgi:hypothetical protein